jgi:hypothetical protein
MAFHPTRRALLRTVPAASLLLSGVKPALAAAATVATPAPPDPWQRAGSLAALLRRHRCCPRRPQSSNAT